VQGSNRLIPATSSFINHQATAETRVARCEHDKQPTDMEVKLKKGQKKVSVNNPFSLYRIMREILKRENEIGQAQEHFWIVGLNNAKKILYIELVALGSANMAVIKPREAFRMAIYKLAVEVILVHNHPSNEVEPSEQDQDTTDHFIQAGKFLNVEVIDHIILGDDDYYSFVDDGLFDILKKSKKYILPFELEEKAHKKGLKEGEKKGKEEKALEMAKAMKEKGVDPKIIKEVSGLTLKKIKDL
jgi:DNA repair protein RadC